MPTASHRTIQSLVEDVDTKQLLLPEIQRGYVWKPGQIAYLFDSLYRGYPTGSMLFWKPSEDVTIRGMAVDSSGTTGAFSPLYLLDGQQRLTSLHRVFHDHEDAQVVFFVAERRFQVQSAATKKDLRWVKVADILGGAPLMDLAKEATAGDGELDFDAVYAALSRVRGIGSQTTYVEVVENLSYGEVAEIFVRVNSRGRPLKTVDLTLALLSTEWPGVVSRVDDVVSHWRAQNWHDIDATFLIRALAAMATENGLLTQLPRTAHANGAVMDEAWKDVQFGIEFVVQIVRENLGITSSTLITSMNALVPLVALLGRHRNAGSQAFEEADALAYWLFGVLITGRFSASVDSLIAQDALAVRKPDPIRALYENAGLVGAPLRISPEQLVGKGASSTYFMLSYLAARKRNAKDWWHDVVIGHQGGGSFALEYHHIHPRATLKDQYTKGEINDLANLAFISATANKKISDRSPADYFPELLDPATGKDQLSPHLVPIALALRSADQYHEFLGRRRELLAAAMNELLDERRPSWVIESTASAAVQSERSLSITLFAEPWNALVFEATSGSDRYVTSVPAAELDRFIRDARDGLASSLTIGSDVVEHGPEADELAVPIGPFLVTGEIADWARVLEREYEDIARPDGGHPPVAEPWVGVRERFDVLDSD